MNSKHILIIDDNDMNVRLISFVLTSEGYQVHSAGDATAAMAAIARQVPDLILMDLQLPGLSGLELTRRLKADPKTRGALIIAITAYAMIGDESKARAAGCDGYLTKPIDTSTIGGVIGSYLSKAASDQPSIAGT